MRIRTIRPEFCTSEAIASLSLEAGAHFVRLWLYADDDGRGIDNARLIKGALWPLNDAVSTEMIDAWQDELADAGRITRYVVDGRRYFEIAHFGEHQKPRRRYPSVLPARDQGRADDSRTSTCGPPKPELVGAVEVEVEVEVDRRSSSVTEEGARGTREGRAWPVDDDGETGDNRRPAPSVMVDAALDELARRDVAAHEARGGAVTAPAAFLSSCRGSRATRHRSDLFGLAYRHPGWTPSQLADAVEHPAGVGLERPPIAEYEPEGVGQGVRPNFAALRGGLTLVDQDDER